MPGLFLRFGFRKADHSLPLLELPPLAKEFDALEALQHTAFGFDGPLALETWMLAHDY